MSNTTARVLALVARSAGQRAKDLAADAHLFDDAILDSFGLIVLVDALDEEFSIAIRTEHLTVQNFATAQDIAALVDQYAAEER